ncbi:NADP-dependent oxidoreductase [Streptomyces muensis]|uniref:NADP-dependent oxidoreductase n=1 Tax=Streptomyces muensis TaxID=1077944 RepID=A0A9X1TL56_STRM4|nr:NADP-dependent oxidoreductase [Streptomyces muensis]MCF1595212.1 NADP-dependent oxidoreductase [Streptomyces muensis]
MRALITTDYAAAPEVAEIPRPEFGPNEVLVKVAASSVNGFDAMVAGGYLKGMLPHTFPAVLGKDFAGTIEAVGADVQGFAPGDEVFGAVMELAIGRGAIAEYAVAQTAVGLTHRPAGLDIARAGALTVAGATAHTAIEALSLQPSDTVLIVGATGGVGSLAVQLAAATGARVLATHRGRGNAAHLIGLGAHELVDATGDLAAAVRQYAPDGVHAALHLGGDLDTVAGLVKQGGRLASAAAQPAPDAYADRGLTIVQVMADASAKRLDHLATEVAEGRLDVPIMQTFTLDDAPEAMRAFGASKHGKIAVCVQASEH